MTRFSKRNQLHKKNSKVLHRNIFPYAKKLEKMKKKMKTKTEEKKFKVLHRSIFPCARRLPHSEENWGTVVAKEGETHNIIKQSQILQKYDPAKFFSFSKYFLLLLRNLMYWSCKCRHYCQILHRNFSAIAMSVIELIRIQLEFSHRLGTVTSLSVWIRTRLKIASYILLESGWTQFLSNPTLTW